MSEHPSLDSIVKGDQPAPVPEAEPQQEAAAPEPVDQAPEPTEAPEPEAKAEPDSKPTKQVPLGALKEERERRQEAERQLGYFQGQFAALQQQLQQLNGSSKQAESDPDETFFDSPSQSVNRIVEQRLARERQLRLAQSEFEVAAQHPDYQEKANAFLQAAQADPALTERMFASPSPARYAYEVGKQIVEFQGLGSVDQWREREREKLREEVRKEMIKQGVQKEAGNVTQSIASAPGAGVPTGPAFQGPRPLDSIIGSIAKRAMASRR